MSKRYIKVGVNGNYIEDVLVDDEEATEDLDGDPITPDTHIETIPADGFILPKWNGSAWIEGGVYDLTAGKTSKAIAAQAEQERQLNLGFRVSIGQNEFVLSSDPGQRELLVLYTVSLLASVTFPTQGVRLITRTGDELTANQLQFQAAMTAWRARVKSLRDHYADILAAIRAASNQTQLAAIDVGAGWPAV